MPKRTKPTKPTTKPSTSSSAPEIAENQQSAAAKWGIPIAIIRAAKAAGCSGFQGSRVHRTPLVAWIASNAAAATAAQALDMSKATKQELEEERLRQQCRILKSKADLSESELILKTTAKDEFARALGIIQEEARGLMERDHYRVFIERSKARIGSVLGEVPQPPPAGAVY